MSLRTKTQEHHKGEKTWGLYYRQHQKWLHSTFLIDTQVQLKVQYLKAQFLGIPGCDRNQRVFSRTCYYSRESIRLGIKNVIVSVIFRQLHRQNTKLHVIILITWVHWSGELNIFLPRARPHFCAGEHLTLSISDLWMSSYCSIMTIKVSMLWTRWKGRNIGICLPRLQFSHVLLSTLPPPPSLFPTSLPLNLATIHSLLFFALSLELHCVLIHLPHLTHTSGWGEQSPEAHKLSRLDHMDWSFVQTCDPSALLSPGLVTWIKSRPKEAQN